MSFKRKKLKHKNLLLSEISDFLGDLDLISILQSTAIFQDTDSFFFLHKRFLSKERLQATHFHNPRVSWICAHTLTHSWAILFPVTQPCGAGIYLIKDSVCVCVCVWEREREKERERERERERVWGGVVWVWCGVVCVCCVLWCVCVCVCVCMMSTILQKISPVII